MTSPVPHVAWVESPFQFLSAAEFAAATGRRLAVAFRLGPQMSETAQELLDRGAAFSTCVPYVGIPWRELARARHWIVGDAFSGQFQLAATLLRPARLTLLDDGDMSLRVASALAGDGPFTRPVPPPGAARRLAGEAVRGLLWQRALAGDLEFATIFGTENPEFRALADAGVRLRHNDFAWTRETARPIDLPPGVVVLGTARVVDGLLDGDTQLRWVASVAQSTPVVYLPHRRETADRLRALSAIPGVSVVRTGLPVELALAGRRDLEVMGSGSSAAATLDILLRGSGSRIRPLAPAEATG
jgi:hypothetical protein